MNTTKRLLVFLIGLMTLTLITVFRPANKSREIEYDGIPTVFVHGYKGTVLTFAKMFIRLKRNYQLPGRIVTYIVNEDGTLQKRSLSRKETRPIFIQVVFKKNRATFTETTSYLATVLKQVKKTYQLDRVYVIGHSMGGIVSVKYAQQYHKYGKGYPVIDRLVTLGSPFGGVFDDDFFLFNKDSGAEDLKIASQGYKTLYKKRFPNNTKVLNIGSTGDTSAVPASVREFSTIVPPSQYQEVIIEDEKVTHFSLHEDERVDAFIYRFLWK